MKLLKLLLPLFVLGLVQCVWQPTKQYEPKSIKYSWEDSSNTSYQGEWLTKSTFRRCVGSDGSIGSPIDCLTNLEKRVYRRSQDAVNWTTARDNCYMQEGRLFDDVSLSVKEMEEICGGAQGIQRWFHTMIWSPANSGKWQNYETGEVIPEKDIDWASGEPDKDVKTDRMAVFGCNEFNPDISYKWWTNASLDQDLLYPNGFQYVCILDDLR